MDTPNRRATPKERHRERSMTQTIQELQDTHTGVQKKVFTKWLNDRLKGETTVNDLYNDIRDGDLLLRLLQALTGARLQRHLSPRDNTESEPLQKYAFQHLDKIEIALKILENNHVKLVNVSAENIAKGVPKIVLGLIWRIILHFQIADAVTPSRRRVQTAERCSEAATGGSSTPSLAADDGDHGTHRKQLLCWVQGVLSRSPGQRHNVSVRDFGRSWRDGRAFNVLLLNLLPGTQVQAIQRLEKVLDEQGPPPGADDTGAGGESGGGPGNDDASPPAKKATATASVCLSHLDVAFSVAEEVLGVTKLLDSQDVFVDQPDEQSIMMYIALLVHHDRQGHSEHANELLLQDGPRDFRPETVSLCERQSDIQSSDEPYSRTTVDEMSTLERHSDTKTSDEPCTSVAADEMARPERHSVIETNLVADEMFRPDRHSETETSDKPCPCILSDEISRPERQSDTTTSVELYPNTESNKMFRSECHSDTQTSDEPYPNPVADGLTKSEGHSDIETSHEPYQHSLVDEMCRPKRHSDTETSDESYPSPVADKISRLQSHSDTETSEAPHSNIRDDEMFKPEHHSDTKSSDEPYPRSVSVGIAKRKRHSETATSDEHYPRTMADEISRPDSHSDQETLDEHYPRTVADEISRSERHEHLSECRLRNMPSRSPELVEQQQERTQDTSCNVIETLPTTPIEHHDETQDTSCIVNKAIPMSPTEQIKAEDASCTVNEALPTSPTEQNKANDTSYNVNENLPIPQTYQEKTQDTSCTVNETLPVSPTEQNKTEDTSCDVIETLPTTPTEHQDETEDPFCTVNETIPTPTTEQIKTEDTCCTAHETLFTSQTEQNTTENTSCVVKENLPTVHTGHDETEDTSCTVNAPCPTLPSEQRNETELTSDTVGETRLSSTEYYPIVDSSNDVMDNEQERLIMVLPSKMESLVDQSMAKAVEWHGTAETENVEQVLEMDRGMENRNEAAEGIHFSPLFLMAVAVVLFALLYNHYKWLMQTSLGEYT